MFDTAGKLLRHVNNTVNMSTQTNLVVFVVSPVARRGRVTSTGCVSQRETPIPAAPACSVTRTPPDSSGLSTKVQTTRYVSPPTGRKAFLKTRTSSK